MPKKNSKYHPVGLGYKQLKVAFSGKTSCQTPWGTFHLCKCTWAEFKKKRKSGQVGQWMSGKLDKWKSGRMEEWRSEKVGGWESGNVREWESKRVGE